MIQDKLARSPLTERILATPRMLLEPVAPGHAETLHAGFRDARLYDYIPQDPPESQAALEKRFEKLAARVSPDGAEMWLNWALRLKVTGGYVGLVEATILKDKTAKLAYFVFPEHWRKGYGAEGCRRALRFLFQEFHVQTVRAEFDARNAASQALLKSIGFRRAEGAPAPVEVKGVKTEELCYEFRRERWDLAMHTTAVEA